MPNVNNCITVYLRPESDGSYIWTCPMCINTYTYNECSNHQSKVHCTCCDILYDFERKEEI
jgi:hypothetical protein